jgi:LysR family transcriptional regulator, nitrogen assimilation regulatory protein
VFEQLLNQGLTLCLIHNPPPHKSIAAYPLLSDAMYLVGPPPGTGALAPVTAKRKLSKSQLDGLPLILPNEAHALRQLIGRALGGARLRIAAQTDGVVTTRALVSAGHGYTILPYSAIHQQLINGQLSAARLSDIDIPWTLSLACWSDQAAARAVLAVRDILAAHFETLVGDDKWGTVPALPGAKKELKPDIKSTAKRVKP